jgi:tRNA threonylcarbamoyladenosine biosynthesis protein TsaE
LIFETATEQATIALGTQLARFLKPGSVVAFYGDLGTGKTTMIKGFARGLGVQETVKSPSFVIITEYQGRLPVYHIDLYRLKSTAELIEIGLEFYLHGDGVCLIEWADRAESFLPPNTIRIRLSLTPNGREISVEGLDPGLAQELKQLV